MDEQLWNVLVEKLRNSSEINIAVDAAARLQSDASTDDIPRLISLLSDPDFFVREAAAWPLSNLGCVDALPALVRAQELGTKDGHDNDGLNAAMLDLVSMNRAQSKPKLEAMRRVNDSYARETVEWLLTFCAE